MEEKKRSLQLTFIKGTLTGHKMKDIGLHQKFIDKDEEIKNEVTPVVASLVNFGEGPEIGLVMEFPMMDKDGRTSMQTMLFNTNDFTYLLQDACSDWITIDWTKVPKGSDNTPRERHNKLLIQWREKNGHTE
jgi:hypothetical protein